MNTLTVNPEDVYSGNIVAGEIHVRAWPADMPASGDRVSFAGYEWLVTRINVLTPGGRRCFVALLLPSGE